MLWGKLIYKIIRDYEHNNIPYISWRSNTRTNEQCLYFAFVLYGTHASLAVIDKLLHCARSHKPIDKDGTHLTHPICPHRRLPRQVKIDEVS